MSTVSLATNVAPPDRYPPIFLETDIHNLEKGEICTLPYKRRMRVTKDRVLEWVAGLGMLMPWDWPLLFLLLVLPQELNAHRLTHLFRNPGCFCSINSPNPHAVTESAIFVMPSGGLKGSVVAACARKTKKCGYFVNLTAIFANTTAGFPVRSYPLRTAGELPAPPIPFDAENFQMPSSSPPDSVSVALAHRSSRSKGTSLLKRTADNTSASVAESSKRAGKRRRIEDVDTTSEIKAGSIIRKFSPPPASEATSFSLMMCLDDRGLSLREFEHLFVICKACKDWVGTRSALETHYCPTLRLSPEKEDVIDLTWDSDSD